MLDKYGVELIGADIDAIQRGENRELFKQIVEKVGAEPRALMGLPHPRGVPRGGRGSALPSGRAPFVHDGWRRIRDGLRRGRLATDRRTGLAASPTTEVLLEESILGWKEFELELMRDNNDNVVVVCSIENLDPLGVHTGDSITVARRSP